MQVDLFDSKLTQAERILKAIREKMGMGGVTNYELSDISLKYSSRISELRSMGYDIRAQRVFRDGKATGTYRYFLEGRRNGQPSHI